MEHVPNLGLGGFQGIFVVHLGVILDLSFDSGVLNIYLGYISDLIGVTRIF